MASTNETPILKLPQFVGTDKPSWLGDFNGAMLKIDTAIGDNTGKIGSVETVANAAQAKADSADAAVTALGGEVSRVAGEVDAHDSEIDALQNDTQNILNAIAGFKSFDITEFKFAKINASGEWFSAFDTSGFQIPLTNEFRLWALWTLNKTPYLGVNVGNVRSSSADNILLCGCIRGNPFSLNGVSINNGNITLEGLSSYEPNEMARVLAVYDTNTLKTYLFIISKSSQYEIGSQLQIGNRGATVQATISNWKPNNA